jgi:uncharacterized membrane protein YphA (DoxX/SURF4 family)
MKKQQFNVSIILQIVIAGLFIIMGIREISIYNSSLNQFARSVAQAFGGGTDVLSLIIAIAEVVAGIVLLLDVFLSRLFTILDKAWIIVIIFWITRSFYHHFLVQIQINRNALSFNPDFFTWLVLLLTDLIFILALWQIGQNKKK